MKLFGKMIDWAYLLWIVAWMGMTAGLFISVFISWVMGTLFG
jgi:hypothetical protein